jgi:hypothetical protein
LTNEDLTRLAYLAQAIASDPSRFDEFVALVEGESSPDPLPPDSFAPSDDLREAIEAIKKVWKKKLGGRKPTIADVVAVADVLEATKTPTHKLAGVALSWAAENQLWRKESLGEVLDSQEMQLLQGLADRATTPGF